MPTAIQLKTSIDAALNQNVPNLSISPEGQAVIIKSVVDFVTQEVSSVEVNSQGIQGIQGIPGVVGPAGLTWRSTFLAGTSYILNDAVGFGGASYFCILATSSIVSPNLNTTNWALLASQGSIGPQGVQGIQGVAGSLNTKTVGAIPVTGNLTPLTFDINTVFTNGDYSLPSLANSDIGKEVVVFCTASNVFVKPFATGTTISSTNVNGFAGQYQITTNQRVRFIYLGNDFWFSEFINTASLVASNFKIFRANVTQSGVSNPVVTVFENTFTGLITIERIAAGSYIVNMPSVTDPNKLFALIRTGSDSSPMAMHTIIASSNPSGFGMFIRTYSTNGIPTLQDSLMNKSSVEIRLYN